MSPTPSTGEDTDKLIEYQKNLQDQQLYQQYQLQQQQQQQFQFQQQHQLQEPNAQQLQQSLQRDIQGQQQQNMQPQQFFQPQSIDLKLQQKAQEAALASMYNQSPQQTYNHLPPQQFNQQQPQQQQQQQQNGYVVSPEKITTTVINLEQDNGNRLLSARDLNELGKLLIYDELGNRHQISDIWSEFKTIFVFVRSFLCFTSKEYVEDLALLQKEMFKQKQVRLVVIGCANWIHIKSFRALTKFPYFIFVDPEQVLYKKLGFQENNQFGRHGDSVHVKSSNVGGIVSSFFRAIRTSKKFDYQGNFEQQGGSMVIGPGPVLHFLHIDQHARDHCPINELLKQAGMDTVDWESLRKRNSIL